MDNEDIFNKCIYLPSDMDITKKQIMQALDEARRDEAINFVIWYNALGKIMKPMNEDQMKRLNHLYKLFKTEQFKKEQL